MKKPYRIFIPKDQTYDYEIWLAKNNFCNVKIQYLSRFSVVIFHDDQEALLFKLMGCPDFLASVDSPDINIIKKIRKSLGIYSAADVLDLSTVLK